MTVVNVSMVLMNLTAVVSAEQYRSGFYAAMNVYIQWRH